jgi:hypothetical protein
VQSREVRTLRKIMILVLAGSIFGFVATYEDTIVPYWEHRVPRVWSHIQNQEFKKAALMLVQKIEAGRFQNGKADSRSSVSEEAAARSAESPEVTLDLVAGTLNGRVFSDYTVDTVTDLLGRPSWARAARIIEDLESEYAFGPEVKYHDLGLHLRFQHPNYDPESHCYLVAIYMAKEWDSEAARNFKPFTGTVVQGVSGDWRAKKVIEEILGPETGPGEHKISQEMYGNHLLELKDHSVQFTYERATRFLESVRLARPKLG